MLKLDNADLKGKLYLFLFLFFVLSTLYLITAK